MEGELHLDHWWDRLGHCGSRFCAGGVVPIVDGFVEGIRKFRFLSVGIFRKRGCLKNGLREPHNHNLCFLFLIYLLVSSQLQILLKQFLMISFEQEHPHSDPSGRGDAHYPRPFLHRSSIHAFRFTLRHGYCFGWTYRQWQSWELRRKHLVRSWIRVKAGTAYVRLYWAATEFEDELIPSEYLLHALNVPWHGRTQSDRKKNRFHGRSLVEFGWVFSSLLNCWNLFEVLPLDTTTTVVFWSSVLSHIDVGSRAAKTRRIRCSRPQEAANTSVASGVWMAQIRWW